MKRFVLVVVLASPLPGCVGDYTAPTSGNLARIEFVNDTGREAHVILYGDATQCRNRVNLRPALPPGGRNATSIAADRDFAFSIDAETGNQYCMSTRSFHAETGKAYEIHFVGLEGGCSVMGLENKRPVTLVHREWLRPFDETGSFCAPQN